MYSKKIILTILLLILLVSCKAKKEDYYSITFDNTLLTVGYDSDELIKGLDDIDYYETEANKKEEEIVTYVRIYVDDLMDDSIYVNDYKLEKGIKDTCSDINGTLVTNNGNTCVLHKEVDKKDNTIILYGDILDDDIDRIDRIEVSYK